MAMTVFAADGTIKLPRSIQKALGLKDGDRIELLKYEDGQVLMIAKNRSITELKGILPRLDLDCSVDELLEIAVKRAVRAGK
ncbi:AbrB family transcriptional regulator [Pseudoduganella sp. FT55W]|uniref:AbrB family transcriptional regulator n=1 Tax=Duganella rivi TaxID=2666083 RepID=A0A7X4KDS6_9BURK|nr:AbrB family transcriptional regulator [Duganella rivi]MYM69729.1 AbrB family transcriptional regulator [Duganella rivi]